MEKERIVYSTPTLPGEKKGKASHSVCLNFFFCFLFLSASAMLAGSPLCCPFVGNWLGLQYLACNASCAMMHMITVNIDVGKQ